LFIFIIAGRTALHICASFGNLCLMTVLLARGATCTPDNIGLTPLMQAAVDKQRDIIEYLISTRHCTKEESISAQEIHGAQYVDSDPTEALKIWRVAMEDRMRLNIVRPLVRKSQLAYGGTEEPSTVEELMEICYNHVSIRMYKILLWERILGLQHPKTRQFMCSYGQYFILEGYIDRGMALVTHALDIQSKCADPLDKSTLPVLNTCSHYFHCIESEAPVFHHIMAIFEKTLLLVKQARQLKLSESKVPIL